MSNPLYQMMGQQPKGNMNVIQRFMQFKNSFNGNPQQMVQQLLNSGKISQAQYNQAVQMANQFSQILGR